MKQLILSAVLMAMISCIGCSSVPQKAATVNTSQYLFVDEVSAMKDVGNKYAHKSLTENILYIGALVTSKDGAIQYTITDSQNVQVKQLVPEGTKLTALYHMYGKGSQFTNSFSEEDINIVNNFGIPVYLIDTRLNLRVLTQDNYHTSKKKGLLGFPIAEGDLVRDRGGYVINFEPCERCL